jgi:hemerythrin
MDSFQWDRSFETGIQEVDEQHLKLVALVNRFGEFATENSLSKAKARAALEELTEYTSYHFGQEERLMKRVGIDLEHFEQHHAQHQRFIRDLREFAVALESGSEGLSKQLLDFLVQWLVYHILGRDQNMARQLRSIQAGNTPQHAFQSEEREQDNAVGPLLTTLKKMFEQVSARNKELILLNRSLEDKVAQRTKELSEANRKLERLSNTDVLTQLPNRRFAMQAFDTQWQISRDQGTSLVCMLIDADNFKQVNDNCGHDAGDAVLIRLAIVLQDAFRESDVVCRLGGDEFIVACPGSTLQQGLEIARQVHERVQQICMPYDNYSWEGSISVGVAATDSSMQDVSDLIKAADDSVYLAKKAGRNCIRTIQSQ